MAPVELVVEAQVAEPVVQKEEELAGQEVLAAQKAAELGQARSGESGLR